MEKIEALKHIETCLVQHLEELEQPAQPHGLVPVDLSHQLQDLREELAVHERFLTAAWYYSTLGQQGEEPEDYYELSGGDTFDAYTIVGIALAQLPRHGQFSKELVAYIEALPALRQHVHDFWLAHARADTTIWPDNPMKQLSEQQVGRQSMAVVAKHTEATLFAGTYSADLAHAVELVRQRGDWAAILDCLA